MGGSTNAVLHLMAIAREAEVAPTLEEFDRISRNTPYIADMNWTALRSMAIGVHLAWHTVVPRALPRDCRTGLEVAPRAPQLFGRVGEALPALNQCQGGIYMHPGANP